jgi:hypothetical protein
MNNTNRFITIKTVGSIYRPYTYEPFVVNRKLRPHRTITFQSGSKAKGRNELTTSYIYNSDVVGTKEGARSEPPWAPPSTSVLRSADPQGDTGKGPELLGAPALIHPSAWNWNSRKSVSSILHIFGPTELEEAGVYVVGLLCPTTSWGGGYTCRRPYNATRSLSPLPNPAVGGVLVLGTGRNEPRRGNK